jgi:hypothetical protein
MFRCEDCGWETPYREFFGLTLGCYECGGSLLPQVEHQTTEPSHFVDVRRVRSLASTH